MGELKMPRKGASATMLQELNAEHAPPMENNEETNVTRLQDYNGTTKEATQQEPIAGTFDSAQEGSPEVSQQERPQPGKETAKEGTVERRNARTRATKPLAQDADTASRQLFSEGTQKEREVRLDQALRLAEEEEPTVVTIRVSPRLNAYMDRYVQRINQIEPKRRYRKQDAVAEAFAAFYADHPMPPASIDENAL